MYSISLVSGPVPVVLLLCGVGALMWLISGSRRHVLHTGPAVLTVTGAAVAAVRISTEGVWNIWGAPLPVTLYVWAWLAVTGAVLAVGRSKRTPRDRRRAGPVARGRARGQLGAAAAGLACVLAAASLTNQYFGEYPTLGALLGHPKAPISALEAPQPAGPATGASADPTPSPPVRESTWTPPADMPMAGRVVSAQIPGVLSKLPASEAYLYLPPAYQLQNAPNLPVLVLVHGLPGGSRDWVASGQINLVMDQYAAAHKGLAPVVVMPDASGNHAGDPPLCLDSKLGKSATYLAVDVPAWVKSSLAAGRGGARSWAIAGFSYGGTCALQLGVNYPDTYPTFLDISGEDQPTINGGRSALVQKYFDGDGAAFARQNAVDVLKKGRFPGSAGVVTVGADDSFYRPQGITVYNAAKATGMDIQLQQVPGGHTWQAWSAGLQNNLDWLMRRYGTVP
ncbi:alpha/beta fold hydrolase [Pseudarthrobacter sp. NPDC080039]|uniref:alpha/beta hydrolase n=1 Tax=unclassified Pseudarthrobacter TaxID=2647000 RepID=UPI00344BA9AC